MTLNEKQFKMILGISLRMRNAEVSDGPKAKKAAKAAKKAEPAKVIRKPKVPARVLVAA